MSDKPGLGSACSLAQVDSVKAYHHQGTLWIIASGKKPSPCHEIQIHKSLLTIEPPEFSIVQCKKLGQVCIETPVPYDNLPFDFPIGPYRETIIVNHRDGRATVKVEKFYEGMKIKVNGPGDTPVPFFKNALGTPPNDAAVGFSNSSFEDAFNKASQALLAGQTPSHPDELTVVEITEMGALYGGFAGYVGKRYVRVKKGTP